MCQVRALNVRNVTRTGRTRPPVLQVAGEPVLVTREDLGTMQARLLAREARRLVLVVVPPAGPPLTLPLGHLLPGGLVSLEPGVGARGSFWENMDRVIHTNGTILYKGTGVREQAQLVYGSVGAGGAVSLLPSLGNTAVTMELLRSLDINTQSSL